MKIAVQKTPSLCFRCVLGMLGVCVGLCTHVDWKIVNFTASNTNFLAYLQHLVLSIAEM